MRSRRAVRGRGGCNPDIDRRAVVDPAISIVRAAKLEATAMKPIVSKPIVFMEPEVPTGVKAEVVVPMMSPETVDVGVSVAFESGRFGRGCDHAEAKGGCGQCNGECIAQGLHDALLFRQRVGLLRRWEDLSVARSCAQFPAEQVNKMV